MGSLSIRTIFCIQHRKLESMFHQQRLQPWKTIGYCQSVWDRRNRNLGTGIRWWLYRFLEPDTGKIIGLRNSSLLRYAIWHGRTGQRLFRNENYTYTIAPSGATSLTLAFSAFDVELNFDTLWIYDGPSASSTLIGAYTGTNSPGTINSTGGAITLRWASDNGIQKPGWRAIWNCVLTTGLEQTSNQIKFTAYPNPFSEQITCTLNSPNLSLSEIEVEIYNVLGKRLQQISSNNSSVKIERADMPSGIYFLKINTASGQQIIKIVAD